MSLAFTAPDLMTVTAARALTTDMTSLAGSRPPSQPPPLPRPTHAPRFPLSPPSPHTSHVHDPDTLPYATQYVFSYGSTSTR